MDAKLLKSTMICLIICIAQNAVAATHSTTNFIVTAPTEEIATKVGKCAEFWREELATIWLKKPLPNWYKPCPIAVKVGQIGAGGSTTFTFENGEVFGWNMEVQGTLERILDSVIPHEVNHTIFASYFRRPLPRWADEGAATLVEHESERMRQTQLLNQVIKTTRRIPLNSLLAMRDYPKDMHQVLTLYAEGYSLADYLVGQKGEEGRSIYLRFLQDAHEQGWENAIEGHYGYKSVSDLESKWHGWIMAGSPAFDLPEGQQYAANESTGRTTVSVANTTPPENELVIRLQSPKDSNSPKETTRVASPPPLAMIPRKLRDDVEAGAYRRERVTQHRIPSQSEYPLTHVARGTVEEFRSRSEDQPLSGPSLHPETLPRSEDGSFTSTDACFVFPDQLDVRR